MSDQVAQFALFVLPVLLPTLALWGVGWWLVTRPTTEEK